MSFGEELVPAMPAMGMSTLEKLGDELAELLELDFSLGPTVIDWPNMIENVLPRHAIHVYPVDPAEIDGDEGATDPSGTGPINVLLRHDIYDALWDAGSKGNRARATMPHELSHCVLHVPRIRRYRTQLGGEHLLRRVRRADLKPFLDPEWQAWALAGCLVAPRRVLTEYRHVPAHRLAPMFGISVEFLSTHMRRLKLEVRGHRGY